MPRFIPKSVKHRPRKEQPLSSIVMPTAPAARIERRENCEACKFHGVSPDGKNLECRQKPPQCVLMQGPNNQPTPVTFFPPVGRGGAWWCGEWKPYIEMPAANKPS